MRPNCEADSNIEAKMNEKGWRYRRTIDGIGWDNFENNDRCLLHVKNLLNQHVGAELSPFIDISLVEQQTGIVVMIECLKVADPVFLKIGKNEEFYIRSGPSSVKLSPSQIVNFVQQNKK